METISVYEGQDPFVFVSYAHKDSDAVYRILRLLQGRGLRIWYDEGITPGSEWPEYIASHLDRAEAVIVFITESSVNSFNCRREITFAQARNKSFISVFLEKTEVPLGMELQLSAQQSMFRYDYASDEAFVDRLIRTPCLQPCIRLSERRRGRRTAEEIRRTMVRESPRSRRIRPGTRMEAPELWIRKDRQILLRRKKEKEGKRKSLRRS